jgi:hypothetical protein
MDPTHHDHRPGHTPSARTKGRPVKIALLMVALIGAFYLLREHWDHVAGSWVYLLLLVCPLMHLLHGHGGHGGHGAKTDSRFDREG